MIYFWCEDMVLRTRNPESKAYNEQRLAPLQNDLFVVLWNATVKAELRLQRLHESEQRTFDRRS